MNPFKLSQPQIEALIVKAKRVQDNFKFEDTPVQFRPMGTIAFVSKMVLKIGGVQIFVCENIDWFFVTILKDIEYHTAKYMNIKIK